MWTGWVACSLYRTTSRLETMVALRSSSSSTTPSSCSRSRASWTMPTAPSTIRCRAPTTALACCWRSMAWAISAAYDSRVRRDSMMCTPAGATRWAISAEGCWVISSALSRSDSAPLPRLSYGQLEAMCRTGVSGWMGTEGGLGRDGDERREVIDGIQGTGRIPDLPDDHGGDLDRVAVGVVDLGLRRFLVADPGGDRDAPGERVHPLQARLRS